MRMRTGMGDVATDPATTPWLTQLINNVATSAGQILTLKQQNDLARVQLDRARAGLAPLDPDSYAAQLRVGLAPSTQSMLMWGAVAGLGVYLVVKLTGRHRR